MNPESNMTLSALKARRDEAWRTLQETEEQVIEPLRKVWHALSVAVEREEIRREILDSNKRD